MKRFFAALLSLALSVPVLAADPDDEAAESQWTPPEAPPSPGTPSSGSSEGDYGSPDRRRMDESRRKDVLDQLCRKLKLRKNFNLAQVPYGSATLGISRRMEADFDNSLVLLDEETLSGTLVLSESRPVGGAGLGVHVGAGISGRSMVVRRLGAFSTCGEVDRLINLLDVKLVLPATPRRIAEMAKGELWRLPLTLNVGYGASLSDALADGTSISVGYSKAKNGIASMTLWRLSEKKTRFRFRADYVQVISKSGGVSATLDPIEFASAGGNVLAGLVDRELAKQLRRYTAAYAAFGSSKSDGRRLILEYVVDPTDPAAADALAEALKGNFVKLISYARRISTSRTLPEETLEAFADLEASNTALLGVPAYAARSDVGAHSRSFTINLPFLVNRTVSEAFGHDQVTRFTGDEGRFEFHSANRSPGAEYFNAPWLGPLVKDLESRNIDVITNAPKGEGHSDPIAVYIHNQGFLRLPVSSVAEMVEDANSILRLAGAARDGQADRSMELPAGTFLPAPRPRPAPGDSQQAQEPSDQKGWLSFTLVMNQKAVRDALAASTEQVLKAFAASVPIGDRAMAEWLVANGKLEDGRLSYDEARAREELKFSDDDNSAGWLAKLSREAAGLAVDLAEAAGQPTPQDRAKALAKSFSLENRSGLAHRDVLRVLVQFMDPLDLTGDFVSASNGTTKTAAKVQAHYQLKKGRGEVPMLRDAGETRARFADGSVLTD